MNQYRKIQPYTRIAKFFALNSGFVRSLRKEEAGAGRERTVLKQGRIGGSVVLSSRSPEQGGCKPNGPWVAHCEPT